MRLLRKTLPLIILLSAMALALSAQSVKFSASPAQIKPGGKGVLKATLTIPAQYHQTYDPDYFYLEGQNASLNFGTTQYPPAKQTEIEGVSGYYGSVTLSLPFTVKATAKPGKASIAGILNFQLCNDQTCLPPSVLDGVAGIEIVAADEGLTTPSAGATETPAEGTGEVSPDTPVSSDAATVAAGQATTSPAPGQESSSPADAPRSVWNIVYYMLLAILGGIVLNFTPCVLPILPIRAMSMVNQAQKDITKLLFHTLLYTLGVLISFGIIAAVIVIARLSGANLTYGFLNQFLSYQLFMLSLLFLFGLSLMGVFELTVPGMNAASGLTSRKGYAGSFFSGIFAFLMGFACMGPFMGPALEVAVRLSSPLLIVFFLLIGLGFALPFVIISLFPKALKIIPKPGVWMNIFKEVMGFLLILLAWKYFTNIWGLTKDGHYLLGVAHYLIFLAFGAYLYGRFVRIEHAKWVQYLFMVLAIGVIAWSAWNYLPYNEKASPAAASATQLSGLAPAEYPGWYKFSAATLDSLTAQGTPVFVDMGASWCANCKANMKNALSQEEVVAAFERKGVVRLYGDFTRQDPVLEQWIKARGGAGVPFNLLFIPGKEPHRMAPLFGKKDILDVLAQLPDKE